MSYVLFLKSAPYGDVEQIYCDPVRLYLRGVGEPEYADLAGHLMRDAVRWSCGQWTSSSVPSQVVVDEASAIL